MLTEILNHTLNHTVLELFNHTINTTASIAVVLEETTGFGMVFGIAIIGVASLTALAVGVYQWIKPDDISKLKSRLTEVRAEKQIQVHRLRQSCEKMMNTKQRLSHEAAQLEALEQERERLNQECVVLMSYLQLNAASDGSNMPFRMTMFGALSSYTLPNENDVKSRVLDATKIGEVLMEETRPALQTITSSSSGLFHLESQSQPTQFLVVSGQLTSAEKHAEDDAITEFLVRDIEETQAEVELFIDSLPGQQLMLTQRGTM